MYKGVIALLLAVVCIMGVSGVSHAGVRYYSGEGRYVGDANGNLYHKKSCKRAKKIKPKYRVHFRSVDDAIRMRYKPCPVCRPPPRQRYLKH